MFIWLSFLASIFLYYAEGMVSDLRADVPDIYLFGLVGLWLVYGFVKGADARSDKPLVTSLGSARYWRTTLLAAIDFLLRLAVLTVWLRAVVAFLGILEVVGIIFIVGAIPLTYVLGKLLFSSGKRLHQQLKTIGRQEGKVHFDRKHYFPEEDVRFYYSDRKSFLHDDLRYDVYLQRVQEEFKEQEDNEISLLHSSHQRVTGYELMAGIDFRLPALADEGFGASKDDGEIVCYWQVIVHNEGDGVIGRFFLNVKA